ncbi:hypothetical protein BUE93_22020 [Chromobacterium amazonense]|uniref:Uncharacterized protein n=1 Tax=Chromobacterium amazonense TaxID=1382803 RepID=A0A2S9WYD9_9NEIS|nr:hypothetical protein BUE93_22020 [Chromobacterium amazonense]
MSIFKEYIFILFGMVPFTLTTAILIIASEPFLITQRDSYYILIKIILWGSLFFMGITTLLNIPKIWKTGLKIK